MTAHCGPASARGQVQGFSRMQTQATKGQYVEKRFRADPDNVEVREPDDEGDRTQIRMPVSSTAQDRDGDQFSEEGLEDLRRQINDEKIPMFLDHGRGSRGSYYGALGMVGRWDSAEIEQEGDTKTLYALGTPTTANPDAEEMVALIEDDMPVGSSVGFRILDYDGDRQDGYEFHSTDLLEISNVGIPSNPETVNAGVGGDRVTAKHARVDAAEIAAAIEQRLADTPTDHTQHDSPMSDDPPTTDSDNDDDLIERVIGLQERMTDTVDDIDQRLSALETVMDSDSGDDGDGEPSKDTTPEEGDDPDTPDGRELSVVLAEDADESAVREFEQLSDAASDGEVDLADPDTTLFATDDTTDDDTEDLI